MEEPKIILENYSEKSVKVSGKETKLYTEQLKKLGGKWNPHLRNGPGWIFSLKRLNDLSKFVEDVNNNRVTPDDPVRENI